VLYVAEQLPPYLTSCIPLPGTLIQYLVSSNKSGFVLETVLAEPVCRRTKQVLRAAIRALSSLDVLGSSKGHHVAGDELMMLACAQEEAALASRFEPGSYVDDVEHADRLPISRHRRRHRRGWKDSPSLEVSLAPDWCVTEGSVGYGNVQYHLGVPGTACDDAFERPGLASYASAFELPEATSQDVADYALWQSTATAGQGTSPPLDESSAPEWCIAEDQGGVHHYYLGARGTACEDTFEPPVVSTLSEAYRGG
jgi:hypothetical protein